VALASGPVAEPWWKSAVVYQVYPRSFARHPGRGAPGQGNLKGITSRLEYLSWLGVDAVWLSPFYPSPMADFGYDVSDYCDVDPSFGDLGDFDELVDQAHRRGIRVLVDWVPNHTSDAHPWFRESRSSRSSPKRDWYVWRDGSPEAPPNNWRATFVDGPAWTWDPPTGQWYLHLFLPRQPDLNWANPEVVSAMESVLRFWLDRGVDGFRVDAVHCLGKDPALPDAPPEWAELPWSAQNDHESTHAHLRRLRRLVDSYPGERVLVGEVFLLSTAKVARYYGSGDELHLAFNFPPLFAPWEEPAWRRRLRRVVEELDPLGAWPTWVLSNHDNPRHRSRYGSERRARAAAVLLLSLRGTPFLYQGEELGLEDAHVPPERRRDPGGRDGCRAPIPWERGPGHGWGDDPPWLPFPPEAAARCVEAQADDPGSMLHLYRRLLAARAGSPALSLGSFEELDSPPGTLAYQRSAPGDVRRVVVNFSERPQRLGWPGSWEVEVGTDGGPRRFSGEVGPEAALVLRPA
jgi:alpha-glucosidase